MCTFQPGNCTGCDSEGVKVFVKRKILSIETILSAHAHTHARTHARTHTHIHWSILHLIFLPFNCFVSVCVLPGLFLLQRYIQWGIRGHVTLAFLLQVRCLWSMTPGTTVSTQRDPSQPPPPPPPLPLPRSNALRGNEH